MAQEEKEDVQQGSSCEGNTDKLQSLEARLSSIRTYLKAESKTEKDAETLKARLDLTSEERNLTSEEEWYKKNLKAEQMQTHEGLEAIKKDLVRIKESLSSAPEEKEIKELRKQADKYLSEVERRLALVEEEEESQIL